jgi:hypothetical protein
MIVFTIQFDPDYCGCAARSKALEKSRHHALKLAQTCCRSVRTQR